jgi:hypothetical protein
MGLIQDVIMIYVILYQICQYLRKEFIIQVLNFLTTFFLAIKQLVNDVSKFKADLKTFLLINSFCNLEEYFSWK